MYDVKLLDYHYTFWEEPQMSGRKLRKEGVLYTKLIEPSTTMRRLGAATLKSHRTPFESWREAYVTLRYYLSQLVIFINEYIQCLFFRVDRLNIYAKKSDPVPLLSYTLL